MYAGFLYPPSQIRLVVRGRRPLLMLGPAFSSREAAERAVKRELAAIAPASLPLAGYVAELKGNKSVKELWEIKPRARVSNPVGEIAISLAGRATDPENDKAVSSRFPGSLWPEAEALQSGYSWDEGQGLFVELPPGSHEELPHGSLPDSNRTWWYVGPDKIAKVMGKQVGAFMKKRSSKTREAFITELAELASLTRAEAVKAARGVEDSPAVRAELEAAKKKRSEASKVRAGRKEAQEKSIRSRAATIGVPKLVAETRRAEQESKQVIASNRKDLKETRAAKRKATPAERKKLDKKVELLKAQIVNNTGMLRISTQRLQLALRLEENCPPAPKAKAEPCPPGGDRDAAPPKTVKLENGTPIVRGSQTLIFYPGPSGPESLKGYYGLIKASELVPSHDPVTFAPDKRYDQSLQERDYAGDKNEQHKVLRQARAFKPALVLNSNPDAVNGPPIIDQQGQVLGGNSRAMTILRVLADTPATYEKALARELADHCEEFGLEGASSAEMKGHVLVRVLTGDRYSSRDISTLFNRALMQTIARETGAVSVGKMIPSSVYMQLAHRLDAGDTLSQAIGKDSASIIEALQKANVITPQNKAEWLVPGGGVKLSAEGVQRLKAGIVGAVIGDRTLATRIAQMPSLANFIERIAPVAMVIDTWDGDNKTGYNWIIALRKALCEAPSVGNKRLGVAGGFEDHYGTTGMFAPSCPQIFNAADPLPAVVLRWLVEAKGTPAKFGKAVFAYWRQIPGEIKHPEQAMLMPRSVADIKRDKSDPDGLRKRVLGMASVADVRAAGGPQRWLAGETAAAVPGPEPPALAPRAEVAPKRPSLTDLYDPVSGEIQELAKGVYYVAGHSLSRDRYAAPRYIEVIGTRAGTHANKGRTLLSYKKWFPDLGRRYGDHGPSDAADPIDSEFVQKMIQSATPTEYFSLADIPRVPDLRSKMTATGGDVYDGTKLLETLDFGPRWVVMMGPEFDRKLPFPWEWVPYATKQEAERGIKEHRADKMAVFLMELNPYVEQQVEQEAAQQQEDRPIEITPGTVYYMPRVTLGQDHYTVARYVLILDRSQDKGIARIGTLSWIPELGTPRELHESSVLIDSRNYRRMQEHALPTRFAFLEDIPPLPDLRYVTLGSSPPTWQLFDGDKPIGPTLERGAPAWVVLEGPRLRPTTQAMGLKPVWEAVNFSPTQSRALEVQWETTQEDRRRRYARGNRSTMFVLAVPERRATSAEIVIQQQQAPTLDLFAPAPLAELAHQQQQAPAVAELEIHQQQAPAPEARAEPAAGVFDYHGPEQKRTFKLSGLNQGQVYYVPQHALGGAILMQVGNVVDAPPGAVALSTDPIVQIRAYRPEPGTSPADAADRWHHIDGERWASIRKVAQPTPYFFLEDMPALPPIPVIAEPDGYFAIQWEGMGKPTKRYIRAPRFAVVSLTGGGFWAFEKAEHDNKDAYKLTLERQRKGQKAFGVNLNAPIPAPGMAATPAKGVRKLAPVAELELEPDAGSHYVHDPMDPQHVSDEEMEALEQQAPLAPVVSLAEARERKEARKVDKGLAEFRDRKKAVAAAKSPISNAALELAERDSFFERNRVYLIRDHMRMDGSEAAAQFVQRTGIRRGEGKLESMFNTWRPIQGTKPGGGGETLPTRRAMDPGGAALREWRNSARELGWYTLSEIPALPSLRARRGGDGKWQVVFGGKVAYGGLAKEPRYATLRIPTATAPSWDLQLTFTDWAKAGESLRTASIGTNVVRVSFGDTLSPEIALDQLDPGMVVTIGKRSKKRYLVTRADQFGSFDLQALSGGMRGSAPSSMRRDQLNIAADQTIAFSGAKAGERSGRTWRRIADTGPPYPGVRSMKATDYKQRTTASPDGKPIITWTRAESATQGPATPAEQAELAATPATIPPGLAFWLPDHRGPIGPRVSHSELAARAADISNQSSVKQLGERMLNLAKRILKMPENTSDQRAKRRLLREAIAQTKTGYNALFFNWVTGTENEFKGALHTMNKIVRGRRKSSVANQLLDLVRLLHKAASPGRRIGGTAPRPEGVGNSDGFVAEWNQLDPAIKRIAAAIWYGDRVIPKALRGYGADPELATGASRGILTTAELHGEIRLTAKGTAVMLVLGPVGTWNAERAARAYDPTIRKKVLLDNGVPVWVDRGTYYTQPHAGRAIYLDKMDDASWRRLLLDLYAQFDRGHLTKAEQNTIQAFAQKMTASHPKARDWHTFDIVAELVTQDERWARYPDQAPSSPEPEIVPQQQQAPAPVAELAPIAQVEVVQQQEFTPPEMSPVEARQILTLFKEGLKEIWQQ